MEKIVKNRKYLVILIVLSILIFGVFIFQIGFSNSKTPELIADVAISPAKEIQISELIDQNNSKLTKERLENNWTFVFFGFTNCPDVCPATLTQLVLLSKTINENATLKLKPQFLFISVDPERDTISHLADYMRYFDPDFIGFTGDQNAISLFEKQFGAFHRYGKKNASGFYTVQHSAEVFLINPDGKLAAKFTPPMDINLLVKQLALLVERYNNATT